MKIEKILDDLLKTTITTKLEKTGNINHDENVDILFDDGYLRATSEGIYKVTNKGKIFIRNGGYSGEICKKNLSKFLQYGFWLANIFGLLVAIQTMRKTTIPNSKNPIYLIIKKDTVITQDDVEVSTIRSSDIRDSILKELGEIENYKSKGPKQK